jgi:hypothetical protein
MKKDPPQVQCHCGNIKIKEEKELRPNKNGALQQNTPPRSTTSFPVTGNRRRQRNPK